MARLLAIGIAVVAAVLLMFWVMQRKMIYLPSGNVPSPAEVGLVGTDVVTFGQTIQ